MDHRKYIVIGGGINELEYIFELFKNGYSNILFIEVCFWNVKTILGIILIIYLLGTWRDRRYFCEDLTKNERKKVSSFWKVNKI